MPRGQPAGEEVYRPEESALDLPRKRIPEMGESPLARGVESFSDAVTAKYQADSATWAGNQLADLRLRMTQKMEDMKQDAQPGAQGFGGDVLKQFKQERDQLIQSAGNNSAAIQSLGPGLDTLRTAFGDDAIHYEATEALKYRASSARDNADKLATIASQHPEQYGDLMGQALSDINGRKLTPDAKLALSQYAESTIAKSAVLTRAQSDPYGTMKALLQPEDADKAISALKPAEREVLLSHADALLHQRVADAERIENMAEKNERQRASSALTSLIVKSRSPQGITTADVLKVAPLFRHEPAALESALALASGKKVETDVTQFAPRYAAALKGNDQTEWALAHVGRDLSQEDFEKFVRAGDKGLPTPFQMGLEVVDRSLKPSPADHLNYAVNQIHADAIEAYQQWGLTNPKATSAEASDYAHQVVRSYSMNAAVLEKTRLAAQPPRFLVGGRAKPDMDATEMATVEAERNGTINHIEAAHQAGIIKQWRDMLAKEEAAAAKRKAEAAK